MPEKLCNFINGKKVAPISGNYIENINPSTQEINNLIPDSDYRDALIAVESAKKAQKAWGALSFAERCVYLDKIHAIMTSPKTLRLLATAETKDMGKPIAHCLEMDIPGAASQFAVYSRMIQSVTTPYFQCKDYVAFEHRDPIGVVGLISPWNFPLLIFCTKVAPAIACGNTCVCKPSELSPTTANLMADIFTQAGLPDGVVNIVNGYGHKAAQPIVESKLVGAISFTGGSVTGSKISAIAGPMLKKLQLELGGKNAAIVFSDCYFEETLAGVAMGTFLNTGQVCCSSSRVLVQRSFFNKFVEGFKRAVTDIYRNTIGDPLDESTGMGPLISKPHFEKVKKYFELAKSEGGRVVLGGKCGGSALGLKGKLSNGNFFEPTIVLDLSDKCRCNCEEIFGPVCSLIPFDTEEEAIRIANQTDYGLAAQVWTSDAKKSLRVARQLEAGSVWVNNYLGGDERQPFGGYKNSGVNRENGMHSIDFFSEIKAIVSKL